MPERFKMRYISALLYLTLPLQLQGLMMMTDDDDDDDNGDAGVLWLS